MRFVCLLVAGVMISISADAQSTTDPGAMLADSKKLSAEHISEWLSSSDPRLQAWAAFWILRDSQTQFLPLLSARAEQYIPPESHLDNSRRDQHDAMLSILDTLIESGVNLSVQKSSSLIHEFPVQSLIMLIRAGDASSPALLEIFKTQSDRTEVWNASGNILAQRRAVGFAAAVLRKFTVHANIAVIDAGGHPPPIGRGGNCVISIPEAKIGWPLVGTYLFAAPHLLPNLGSSILANGKNPVEFRRIVDQKYDQPPSFNELDCRNQFADPDGIREGLLQTLLENRGLVPPLKAGAQETFVWRGDAAFRNDVMNCVSKQEENIAATKKALINAGFLDANEPLDSFPRIQIYLQDSRKDQSTRLPKLRRLPRNVELSGGT